MVSVDVLVLVTIVSFSLKLVIVLFVASPIVALTLA